MTAWGVGPILNRAITIRNGGVERRNFHDFPMTGMEMFPKAISTSYVKTNR